MAEDKLIIQAHKYGGESSVISVRFPNDMIAEINEVTAKTGRTRNEIVVLALEYALSHMQIETNDGRWKEIKK